MEPIYIFLSTDVEALLQDNGIDLMHELNRQGMKVNGHHTTDPTASKDEQTRDLVLVILASTAAFGGISAGIAKIIDALGRNKKTLVTELQCESVVAPNGEPVRRANGEPVLQWVERSRLIESQQVAQDQTALTGSFGGDMGIKYSFASGTAAQGGK